MPAEPSPRIAGELHGYSDPPQTSVSSRQVTPETSSAAPSRSMRCRRRAAVGIRSTIEVTASAMMPTGRLTRNTQRQEK